MHNVLVTGASGFIGRHLVTSLIELGLDVTCLVRKTSNRDTLDTWGCRFVFGELRDAESVMIAARQARPDAVFHLAGSTKAIQKRHLYHVNQLGTRHLLQALARLQNPPTTIMVSTLAAAGPSSVDAPKVETDPPNPVSHYGKSKLNAEQEGIHFSDQLPLTIVRPPIVFGTHDRDTLEIFKSVASLGIHVVPTFKKIVVSWIEVRDLCNALVAAMLHGNRVARHAPDEGIYFATSPEIVDYRELGKRVGTVVGRRRTIAISTASPAVWGIAGVNELFSRLSGRPSILNFDKAREATAGSWSCSGEKLQRQLNFRCHRSLNETLRTSANWYREAGWL